MLRNSTLRLATTLLATVSMAGCASMSGGETEPIPASPTSMAANDAGNPSYADGANWLCLPGRQDACGVDLDAAVIAKDGAVTVERFQRASSPAVDCFYVYPTVSLDTGMNSDMNAGPEERAVVAAQFARYGAVCRTFAPLYRQITLSALRAREMAGGGRMNVSENERAIAYGDVKRAWQHYLRNDNNGRGVILVGHSQGSGMLSRLIADEIETSPVRNRVIAAHLIGTNVKVPDGAPVGGDFERMPLCSSDDETGCIVSYVSFRDNAPPPARTMFGRSYASGNKVACVNPAQIGSAAKVPLVSYLSNAADGSQADSWVEGRMITQRFVKMPGFLSAQCVDRDNAQYLSVTVNADPSDPRSDTLTGDVIADGQPVAAWGLHVIDVHAAMGDLVELAKRQTAAYTGK